jgi:serine/tyrosine/threonine adenylyltransferase
VGNALYQPLGDSEADQADQAAIATWLRQWAERVAMTGTDADRQASMRATNPKYVLRNYLAQVAIDRATGGDMSEIETLLDVLRHPYDDQPGRDDYAAKRPEWARERAGCSMLSCSS